MTVYERIVAFKDHPWASISLKGTQVIGMMVATKWVNQGGSKDQLETIQSVERFGTFMVLDYPNAFASDIDQTIHTYVKNCTTKRQLIEKPPLPPVPTLLTEPQKKLRKRIPAQKPAYSGKMLKR